MIPKRAHNTNRSRETQQRVGGGCKKEAKQDACCLTLKDAAGYTWRCSAFKPFTVSSTEIPAQPRRQTDKPPRKQRREQLAALLQTSPTAAITNSAATSHPGGSWQHSYRFLDQSARGARLNCPLGTLEMKGNSQSTARRCRASYMCRAAMSVASPGPPGRESRQANPISLPKG